DPALLARLTGLPLARRAVRRRRERLVAATTFSAAGDRDLLAGRDKVLQHVPAVAVADDRPRWPIDDEILGTASRALRRPAALDVVRARGLGGGGPGGGCRPRASAKEGPPRRRRRRRRRARHAAHFSRAGTTTSPARHCRRRQRS